MQAMYWQSPDGHNNSAEVVREYEVELTYSDGRRVYRSVGAELEVARALATSPADWDPPGNPGVIRYREIVTITTAWTPFPVTGEETP